MEELSILNLKQSLETLEKAFHIYSVGSDNVDILEMYEDSCIQRFEYTFECAWKLMKKYFKSQYNKTEEELSMNNIFRLMESFEFVPSWLSWKNYNHLRNNTSHEYNKIKAKKVVLIIPEFVSDIKCIITRWDKL